MLWELGRDTLWWRWPLPGTFLYSTWLQKNFWEICVFHWVMDIWNCTFPISTMEIEIFKWLQLLNIALGTWQRPIEDPPPGTFLYSTWLQKNLRNMCFPLSNGHLKLHFSYLYNGNWNFQMTTTCLILLWELGRHYPPTGTFLYSTWMQKKFWEICVLHWVVNIWNCTFSISTMGIEIFKWLNSLNIALGTWQRKPSDGDDPHQVHSCTLPDCEIIQEYVFSTE